MTSSTDMTQTPVVDDRQTFGDQLRTETAAVSITIARFGVSRVLGDGDQERAARPFGADKEALKSRKQILNTKHEKFKAVSSCLSSARATWKEMTVPYPQPKIRLIRRDRVEDFERAMTGIRSELTDAITQLEDAYRSVMIPEAKNKLGELFSDADYPETLTDEFGLDWEYPSIEPPDYLRELNPALWEQEHQRVSARFTQAVELAETAFQAEFSAMIAKLVERLEPGEDGSRKVFRDSAMDNLTDFFGRFSSMSIGSNPELERLVGEAQSVVQGVKVEDLRQGGEVRDTVSESMGALYEQLTSMQIDGSDRRIVVDDD